MKFFHLADLHIGKKVNHVSMLDEQVHVLNQVLDAIERERPDAVILAGDIYDRRNPGVEAVNLLDDFLSKVILNLKVPVLAIGGNHDNGERLGFASGILARAGLHLEGALRLPVSKVSLEDADGEVHFHLLPYADLATLRHLSENLADATYAEAMATVLAEMDLDPTARHVLVAHGVVFAPNLTLAVSDSERELTIGGSDAWSAEALSHFHYVALGHLHRPQRAGAETVRYAGSLLKYSFSEENHEKSLVVVELDGAGCVTHRLLPLLPLHDLRSIRGELNALLTGEGFGDRNDYLRVMLEDRDEVFEPMARLRAVYPNIMTLERIHPLALAGEEAVDFSREGLQRSPLEQFAAFYESLTEEPLDAALREKMAEIINAVKEADK